MPMSERTLSVETPNDPSRVPNFDAIVASVDDEQPIERTTEPRPARADESEDRGVGGIPARGEEDPDTHVVEPTEDEKREARSMGWVDKRAFRGDPNNWVDATTFLKRGREVLPIVKSQLEAERSANAQLRQEVAEIKEAAKSYTKFVDDQQKLQREYRYGALKEARKEALQAEDFDRVNNIDIEMQELRATAEKKTNGAATTTTAPDPEAKRLWDDNVRTHPFLSDAGAKEDWQAEAISVRLAGNKDVGQKFVDRVNDRMRRLYPERFDQRRRPAMVDDGGEGGPGNTGGGERSWDNLLPGYKREYEKSANRLGVSRKDFLANCDAKCFQR